MDKNYILTASAAGKKMERMAFEILENNFGENDFILAGIRESGTVIARNIQQILAGISSVKTELLTVSLDKKKPEKVVLSHETRLNDRVIILIDDVANSGKTLLYALKPFLDAFPKKIQTLVLVERRHNAFPIRSDYVGLSIATTLQEHIYVEVEGSGIKGAYLE